MHRKIMELIKSCHFQLIFPKLFTGSLFLCLWCLMSADLWLCPATPPHFISDLIISIYHPVDGWQFSLMLATSPLFPPRISVALFSVCLCSLKGAICVRDHSFKDKIPSCSLRYSITPTIEEPWYVAVLILGAYVENFSFHSFSCDLL